jgi:phage baseplate assembly protein W
MIYEVTNAPFKIDFMPADEIFEIIQNVQTIISTVKNTAPLYREFGISAENLDLPINIAQTKIAAELAAEIAQFEPRCQLKKVLIGGDFPHGELKITAFIEV